MHTHFVIQFHVLNFLFSVSRSHSGARASCLGRNRVGASNRAEPAENRRAQRRHRLGRHTRNPASTSHGRLRLGVDLFGRASRGYIVVFWQFAESSVRLLYISAETEKIYIISQKAKFNPWCLNHAVLLVSSRIADCTGARASAR